MILTREEARISLGNAVDALCNLRRAVKDAERALWAADEALRQAEWDEEAEKRDYTELTR